MRSLLSVLALAYVFLVPIPALAQTSQGGPSDAQYGGNDPGGGTARGAIYAALLASGALQSTPEEDQATQGNPAAAAESSAGPSERDAASSAEALGESSVTAEAQGESSVTAEAQGDSADAPNLEKLPQTGGPSPLWLFGAPLICICGLLARRIVLP
jgi:hypothetical protein